MCISHAVLIQRDLFLTVCARNAYLGSKLEYEIFLPKRNEQFLPCFKQLGKKIVTVMIGENCQILQKCDSFCSPEE